MCTIYLIGFMGSGKSTVGNRLSFQLNIKQMDTDTLIEEKKGKKITKIFQEEGEASFRKYETAILKSIVHNNCVVSTGGGIVEKKENIDHMKKHGTLVYLHASFDDIVNRLKYDQDRPLWNNDLENKYALYNQRHEIYLSCADFMLETDEKTPYTVADEVIELINQMKQE
ncbi:shikimate kinase [Virgibacillus byunsanensis]|uniref:Shikimate kinase n=1 Tax=Virgibacillus byunsanensis TaxID=570945 RepID=A0ABW3LNI4_9BACI